MSYKENISFAEMRKQQALKKLKVLQESFDKKYIEDMFEAMVDAGIATVNLNMVYEYKGFRYSLRREPILQYGGMMPANVNQ